MVLILPSFVIIIAALILVHLRKTRLLGQYAALASKAIANQDAEIESALRPLRELMLTESLRRGILSSVIGGAVLAISLFGVVETDAFPNSLLLVAGIILGAHGCGSLLTWFIVDRPRMK